MIYIIAVLIAVVVYLSYKLGKQSIIINIKQKQANKTNNIDDVINELKKGKF